MKKKPARPPEQFVLMLDENLSGKSIVEGLTAKGIPAKPQTAFMARGISDEELLDNLAQHPDIYLISKDSDFRYKPSVKNRLESAKVGAFVITATKNKTGTQLVDLIAAAWPRIIRFVARHQRPFVAKINGQGSVKLS